MTSCLPARISRKVTPMAEEAGGESGSGPGEPKRAAWLVVGMALLFSGCAAAATPYRSFDDVDYGYPKSRGIWGPRSKLHLSFEELDEPANAKKSPLVLLHPWGFTAEVWADVAPALATDRRVVLVDLPAHGKSDKTAKAYPMERLGAAVLDVMDAAGIDRAVIAGNSLGGATSIATALMAPERVAALILISAPGGRALPEILTRSARQVASPRQMETLSEEAWRVGLASVPLGDSPTARRVTDDFLAMRDTEEWGVWCRATIAVLNSVARYAPELERIQAPTLVVHAENDFLITRGLNEGFVERIPKARMAVLEDCGHMPEVECPGKLLAPMSEFLSAVP